MFLHYPRLFIPKCAVYCLSTSSASRTKHHYDVLGLTSKATQAEIKSAYYKLSKVYHPDKNQGSADASTKFRDITEAYEILGNVRLRRLYDKGVHVGETVLRHPAEDDDPRTKFYRSREHRHRPMGRTPVYDFDEWSRAHYTSTFGKDMERKRRQEFIRRVNVRDENDIRVEKVIFAFMVMMGIVMFMARDDFDRDRTVQNHNHKPKPS